MSNSAMSWAMGLRIEGPAKAVLLALAFDADDEGFCQASQQRLSDHSGHSESTVRRSLKELMRLGLVLLDARSKYHLGIGLALPQPVTVTGLGHAEAVTAANKPVTVAGSDRVKPVTVAGEPVTVTGLVEAEPVTAVGSLTKPTWHKPEKTAVSQGRLPSASESEARKEVSKNPPTVPPAALGTADDLFGPAPMLSLVRKRAPAGSLANGQLAEFETFWAGYPKKKAKGRAMRAYAKALTITTAAVLLAALDRDWGVWRYIPYASTWLNDLQWTDENQCGDPALRALGLDPNTDCFAGLK